MISFNVLGNYGHLGNQMFQYASLRGIANKNNLHWIIPPKEYFGLNYSLRSSIYDCFELYGLSEENIGISDKPTFVEKFYHFDEILFNLCPDNINLQGYFQSEKYFKDISEEIRKDFTFKDKFKLDLEYPYASLHVRRTDYLLSNHQNNLTDNYYSKAIFMLPEDIKIIVMSDDIEWCREQEIFSDERFIFSMNNSYTDLYLMSKAKYIIMANSSFSWWGAWLNEEAEKVICPSRWLGSELEHEDTKDLFLKNWIRI